MFGLDTLKVIDWLRERYGSAWAAVVEAMREDNLNE